MAIFDTKARESHEQDEGGCTIPREASLEFPRKAAGAGRKKGDDGS